MALRFGSCVTGAEASTTSAEVHGYPREGREKEHPREDTEGTEDKNPQESAEDAEITCLAAGKYHPREDTEETETSHPQENTEGAETTVRRSLLSAIAKGRHHQCQWIRARI